MSTVGVNPGGFETVLAGKLGGKLAGKLAANTIVVQVQGARAGGR
jgi:hypothetical protein